MSAMTENPDMMIEVIAVLIRRAGGSVKIMHDEAPGPFNILSRIADDGIELVLQENLTHEDVKEINASGGIIQ